MSESTPKAQASPPRTVRDLVSLGRSYLERQGVDSPRLEVELLVAHALGTDRLQLFMQLDRPVEESEVSQSRELLLRRAKGEPSAYLTGRREFYCRDFAVGPGVLIPRPETELIVDLGRERVGQEPGIRILDVGTGSGCLAITLAMEVEGSHVTAVELSPEALAYALKNAERIGPHERPVEFLLGDGLEPVKGQRFDLVVSNPPYIRPESKSELSPSVSEYEPEEALYGPAGERDHWVRLLVSAEDLLEPGGTLLVELGFDQEASVRAWLEERGTAYRIHEDLEGIPRVLELGPGVSSDELG